MKRFSIICLLLGVHIAFFSCKRNATLSENAPSTNLAEGSDQQKSFKTAASEEATPVNKAIIQSKFADFKKLKLATLDEKEANEIFDIVLYSGPGGDRNKKLRFLLNGLPVRLIPSLILKLGNSSFTEDVDLARDIIFTRSHELSADEIFKLIAGKTNNPLLLESSIAAAAKRILDDNPLQKAIEWASSFKKPDLLKSVIISASIGNQWQEVVDLNQDSPLWTNQLIGDVARNLGRLHPEEGKNWVEAWSKSSSTFNPTGDFVDGWLSEEPQAASNWVNSLEPSPQRDTAARAVVLFCLRGNDIDSAERWVEFIKSPELKSQTATEIQRVKNLNGFKPG